MTLFSKIVSGEIPCYKVLESDKFLAFLDIMVFAKKVSNKIKKVFPCNRVGVSVIGLEVPHAHIHLLPINNIDDINFSKEKLKFTSSELSEIALKISQA